MTEHVEDGAAHMLTRFIGRVYGSLKALRIVVRSESDQSTTPPDSASGLVRWTTLKRFTFTD
jgi:hypothetical protein